MTETLLSRLVRLSGSPIVLDAVGAEVEREVDTAGDTPFVSLSSTLALQIDGESLNVNLGINGYVDDCDRLRQEIADALQFVNALGEAVESWRASTETVLLESRDLLLLANPRLAAVSA